MTPDDPTLCWRVERACAAAWPAARRDEIAGWAVSRSGGGTRRINSASPAGADTRLDVAGLAAIEFAYAEVAQPAILRLTDLTDDAVPLLDAAGYAPAEGSVRTLYRATGDERTGDAAACEERAGEARAGEGTVILDDRPGAGWLAGRRHLSVACGAGMHHHTSPAMRVSAPACFARIEAAGAACSAGFVVLHDGIAVIEGVATAPDRRRRGHAAALVSALLQWAVESGAHGVALQVEMSNAAARRLYRRLGFTIDLYGYHYRRKVLEDSSSQQ